MNKTTDAPGPAAAATRQRKVILCVGQHCNRGGQAEPLYAWLERRLGERKPPWAEDDRPLAWGIKPCLSHCERGPNLLVQPEGRVCHSLTLDELVRVVEALADGVDLPDGIG